MRLFLLAAMAIASTSVSASSLFTLENSPSYTPIGCLSFLFPTPYHTARQLSSLEKCIDHCTEANHEIIAWEPLAKGVLCTCGTSELFGSSGDVWDECDDKDWRVLLNDKVSLGITGGDEKRGVDVKPFIQARIRANEKHLK